MLNTRRIAIVGKNYALIEDILYILEYELYLKKDIVILEYELYLKKDIVILEKLKDSGDNDYIIKWFVNIKLKYYSNKLILLK